MEGNGNSYSCTKCRFTVEDYHCLDIKKTMIHLKNNYVLIYINFALLAISMTNNSLWEKHL